MRLFRVTLSAWWNPDWRISFRKSWRQRRYWLGWYPVATVRRRNQRSRNLQLGPLSLRLYLEGVKHG